MLGARFGALGRALRFLRRQLPPANFITIHYGYFIGTCLLSAIIFWGSSSPHRDVSFTNSLFLCVSAMTLAGLNTVNLSELNTFQQFILFFLIIIGSAIFVSAFVVGVRQRAFEKKFVDIKQEREMRGRGRTRQKVRTWAHSTLGRSFDRSREMETVDVEKGARADDDKDATPNHMDETEDARRTRDLTPPARRGAAEMNESSPEPEPRRERAISHSGTEKASSPAHDRVTFSRDTRFHASHPQKPVRSRRSSNSLVNMQGVGARPRASLLSASAELRSLPSLPRSETFASAYRSEHGDISRYFSSATGWISRNSQFHGLSQDERDLLGGCEYRAVSFLSYLVPLYFVLWQLLGSLGCGAWVAYNKADTAIANGLNPWWVGAFNAVSAFNNSGMSLLDANMVAFQRSYYLLLTMGLLILAGNTCYPIFLRLIIWCLHRLVLKFSEGKSKDNPWVERAQTLKFLLDHPRRCYTNLFPARHTWWLALSVFTLNGVDWAAFEILNIGNSELDQGLPTRYRVIDGLFQAFAVRSGGFYVVAISTLRISLQVLYVVMMYISVYPVVITMRNSNVYEERSLGIYADDQDDSEANDDPNASSKSNAGFLRRQATTIGNHFLGGGPSNMSQESNAQFLRHQLRAQLAHDAWWIVLALFLIMICEAHAFHKDPVVFSVFNFIFEIVSAYGCVGISVGVPWNAYSFCGAWNTLSKLILCAVMLRGRHRGLPVAIDKAVLLPGEMQGDAEEEDGRIRIMRTRTVSRGAEDA